MKKDVIILTVGTLKGGVGKTSVLFNLAGCLALENKKILCIDVDPQANTTLNFGIDISNDYLSTMNIFFDAKPPSMIVQKSLIKELPGLDILPGSIFLTKTEMQLISQAGREMTLLNYIKKHYEWFNVYDYILIDTNPSMSVINQNAFVAADNVLLVSEASFNSYTGADLFISMWKNICNALTMKNNITAFVINRYDSREKSSKEFLDFVSSEDSVVSNILLKTIIPKSVKIKDASELSNVPLCVYEGKHKAGVAFTELADELKEKGIL